LIWIEHLQMSNWLCYRGEHSLELEPTVYAVCAERLDDPESSNWGGKTGLVESIRFALFGSHRKDREDDWITHGEKQGGVRLTLSDTTTIERSRKRGKTTQLVVTLPDGGELTKAEAQTAIETLIGLSEADALATCDFAQDALPFIVRTTPAKRMEIVGAWLELEPLERCEARMRDQMSECGQHLRQLLQNERGIGTQIVAIANRYELEGVIPQGPEAIAEQLQEMAEAAEETRRELSQEVRENDVKRDKLVKWNQAVGQAERYDLLVLEGKATAKRLAETWDSETDPDIQMKADHAYREKIKKVGAARDERDKKQQLARGRFDGKCPVGDCPCPIADDLNAPREKNQKLLQKAVEDYAQLQNEALGLKETNDEIDERSRDAQHLRQKLETMRLTASNLQPSKKLIVKIGNPPTGEEHPEGRQAHEEAALKARELARDVELIENLTKQLHECRRDQAETREELEIMRRAVWLFGRDGAQRVAAELSLGQIESGAVELLRECAIDLSLRVQWGRTHSSKLADQCEGCGVGLPTSKRVKSCPDCGAERGSKVIPRLDIELSDRSGAADDLGGAAFQLSAGAWLRTERDTRWGVACIDEPFGKLDPPNRRQFATHLTAMLTGHYGFQQAFIISHTQDTVDMLPAKILISADEDGSSPEVV